MGKILIALVTLIFSVLGATAQQLTPGSGITQLTGDVTAGPGSGSVASTVANSAWTTYTPTPTCGSGTLTASSSVAAFKQLGKLVFIRISFTITTLGTCATSLALSLPVNPLASTEMSIFLKNATTNATGGGRIRSDAVPANSITGIADAGGNQTTFLSSGITLVFDGVYEAN